MGRLSAPAAPWVALEVGGTHVAAAAVAEGRPFGRRWPLAADASAEELLGALEEAARGVHDGDCNCVVALPGPFDYARGVGVYGLGKFDALRGVDVGAALGARLGGRVVFLNDADAFALGAWSDTPRPACARLVGLTLGTGVGSGWVADGRIVTDDESVPPSGDIHTLTVDGAPLESFVSTRAICTAHVDAGGEPLDVLGICALARDGDARAGSVLHRAMTVLGETLAPWLDRFGAERLVVGGSMAGSWDVLGPALLAAAGPQLDVGVEVDTEGVALRGAAWFAGGLASG